MLRATGMPLGLMPGMDYDETKYDMSAGEVMVLTSDGITEAHREKLRVLGIETFESADYKEGTRAFLEKRLPRFLGR